MYNPMQSRLEQLNQQKQMIEQQLQMLQQYQMPPININNQIAPQTNYDFGCKWVENETEAKNLPNNVIGFHKNEPLFYMSGKVFKFEEVNSDNNVNEKINDLESKINTILEKLEEKGGILDE